jgi:hypothetical protein
MEALDQMIILILTAMEASKQVWFKIIITIPCPCNAARVDPRQGQVERMPMPWYGRASIDEGDIKHRRQLLPIVGFDLRNRWLVIVEL